jgi:hypothetical protein
MHLSFVNSSQEVVRRDVMRGCCFDNCVPRERTQLKLESDVLPFFLLWFAPQRSQLPANRLGPFQGTTGQDYE